MNILKLLVSLLQKCAQKGNRVYGNIKTMLMNHPEIYWHCLIMAHDCTFLPSSTTIHIAGHWLIMLRSITDQPREATAVRRLGEISLYCMSQQDPGASGAHGDVVQHENDATALTAPAASKPHAKNNRHFLSSCHNHGALYPLRPLRTTPSRVRTAPEPKIFQLLSIYFRLFIHSSLIEDVPGCQR